MSKREEGQVIDLCDRAVPIPHVGQGALKRNKGWGGEEIIGVGPLTPPFEVDDFAHHLSLYRNIQCDRMASLEACLNKGSMILLCSQEQGIL